ncbi:MAG: ACP S-malonyltransferase [Planctomycetaceae bacterium]
MSLNVDSVGFVFPGQGAQSIGMGRWLVENHPSARELYSRASALLGYDLLQLCLNGPAEQLDATEFSQPALFVASMAAVEVLRQTQPELVAKVKATAGLSLGEYSAICFAGGLNFDDTLRLVQQRGRAMQAAADLVPSGMASVIGLDLEAVTALCDQVRREGEVLQPANILCAGNIACSGHRTAIDRLVEAGPAAGATKVIPLAVAGAFHTSLMQPAAEALAGALRSVTIGDFSIPVYSNVDATSRRSGEGVADLLSQQLVSPVRWEDSIRKMIDDGIEGFVEVGTGKVLRGTIKRVTRKIPLEGFGDGEA